MRGVSDMGYAPVSGNSSTGGWFGILGGTHEKRLCFIHVTVKNSLGFTLQDCNRVMEHTRFLLLTRNTSVEGYCSKIETERSEKDRRVYLLHSLRHTLFFFPRLSSLPLAPPRALMKEGAWTCRASRYPALINITNVLSCTLLTFIL